MSAWQQYCQGGDQVIQAGAVEGQGIWHACGGWLPASLQGCRECAGAAVTNPPSPWIIKIREKKGAGDYGVPWEGRWPAGCVWWQL